MTEVSKFMLIKADADKNNNKFWEAILHADNTVHCRWGRVGANGQSKTFNGGQSYIDKKIKEKEKKGYRKARVTANTGGVSKVVGGNTLISAAKSQIKHSNCPITAKLIDMLVKANIHQITAQSGGQLTVDVATGSIQLPSGMGVLTQDAIDDARILIDKIDKGKKKRSKVFKANVQDYLMLVPQVVGRSRGWIDSIFVDNSEIASQCGLLDSLEATLKTISTTPKKKKKKPTEVVFDVDLVLKPDAATRDKVTKLYKKTWQSMHQSSTMKVKKIYAVRISTVANAFETIGMKCGNIQELWHGTSIANLLSILKSGLLIPSRPTHGFMFGAGLYFSDQSTKALNYASGYWSGGRNNNCFMFLADVAMGKSYTPSSYGSCGSLPKKGYDSTFAEGRKSGVANNEMIVYKTCQANLKYLVEFGR
jgi:poly [ADP-ribose] polymerase